MLKNNFLKAFISITLLTGCASQSHKNDVATENKINESLDTNATTLILQENVETVNFKFNSSSVDKKQEMKITKTLDALNKAPDDSIVLIKGYTDKFGTQTYNKKLGMKRAKEIKDKLLQIGLNENQVITESFGETGPLIYSDNKKELRKNRRATIEIISAVQRPPVIITQ